MMSNGPCSARRSVHSGARAISAASTSSGERSTQTRRKPSRCRPFSERRSCERWLADDVRAEVAVRPRRGCARGRSPRAVSSTIATANRSCSRASSTQRLARLALHVRGVDDGQRGCAQAPAGDEVQHRERVLGGALWSFSSSATRPRQKSDEITSVGVKWRARERALARAGGADQHDEARIGQLDPHRLEHRHLRRRPDLRRPRGRPAGSARGSRGASATPLRPGGELRARPLEAVVGVAELPGRQRLPAARCTRAFGVVTTTVAGRAEPNTFCSTAAQARRVEVLDHLDERGGVEAGQALVAVGQRAVQQLDRARAGRRAARRASAAARPARARGPRRRRRRPRS